MPSRQILWGRTEPAPYMSARDRARALNGDNLSFAHAYHLTQNRNPNKKLLLH